jgi:HPt (histidine-containing phosphotransfer) domain-containing protein
MDELPKKHLFTTLNYLLDLDHLRALEDIAPGGDVQKFMSELCILFLKDAPSVIQDLSKALSKGDFKGVTQHSYRLKSMSSSVGATYMADLCLQIENEIIEATKDLALARTIGEQLKDAFLVTRDQIQAYVAQLPKPH